MNTDNKLNYINYLPSAYVLTFILITFILTSCLCWAEQASDLVPPEFSHTPSKNVPINEQKQDYAKNFIAVTAHPLASQAAYNILEKGGSAIDAMVTTQVVLGLVEPQSSGLGGGAFTLYYDASNNTVKSFDGRETAPIQSTDQLFMSDETTPMQFFEAVVGGRSVGTPGTVKLLWRLHQQYGKLPWSEVIQPAIHLAKEGFIVSPRLAQSVKRDQSRLKQDADAFNYFFPNGKIIKAGDKLININYANTLITLAKQGGEYFYNSEISKAIIDKVTKSSNKGLLSQADFDSYQIIERKPVCSEFYEYKVCGMGPPSSGAIAVNQILGILESLNIKQSDQTQAETWQVIAEASRLAFADRAQYLADPDFIDVPLSLLDKDYLTQRSKQITPFQRNEHVSFGIPPNYSTTNLQQGNSPEQASTSHFVLVDKERNIVSMTSTIENAFGSRLMVKGFMLNNELTDFSFLPHKGAQLVANRVEPGKRPRSSMAPTIVFKNDKPILALGSPGGSRIINFVAHSLLRVLAWNEELQYAFNQAHVINRFGRMEIEKNTLAETWKPVFEKLSYPTVIQDINSGLHGVHFKGNTMIGAVDKRREGLALGD